MPFDDVQHGLLLVGSEQAFAFAAAVVRPLPEVGYQADDDASALIVGQIVQYIHESFGIAHFPAGTEKGAVTLYGGKPFGTDNAPAVLFGGHALHGQLAEAAVGLGASFVEA